MHLSVGLLEIDSFQSFLAFPYESFIRMLNNYQKWNAVAGWVFPGMPERLSGPKLFSAISFLDDARPHRIPRISCVITSIFIKKNVYINHYTDVILMTHTFSLQRKSMRTTCASCLALVLLNSFRNYCFHRTCISLNIKYFQAALNDTFIRHSV